jgi:predicted transposase/invertase (TIGR01784 family)
MILNPRVDLAFKRIFGVEENKDLTISLINSIVSMEDQVADITLLNPYNPQNFANDKLSILDIKAKGLDGKLFNIEIQVSDEANYDKRALYYWAKLYTDQLRTGDDYGQLSKAIGIHILNFNSISDTDDYHNTFHVIEKDKGFQYFKDMELHTIELNKFKSSLPDDLQEFVGKIKTSLDVWSSFLTRHDLLNTDNLPQQLKSPEMARAIDVLSHINLNETERDAYEDRLKWLRIQNNSLKKQFNDGLEKGREEGREEGKEIEKEKLARKLFAMGQDPGFVSKATSLSIEEVDKIYKSYSKKRKPR